MTFPPGFVTVLNAFAEFELPTRLAALLPEIDGEPVQRIVVAAEPRSTSTVSLITKSGRRVRADELTAGEQLKLAQAIGVLSELR